MLDGNSTTNVFRFLTLRPPTAVDPGSIIRLA